MIKYVMDGIDFRDDVVEGRDWKNITTPRRIWYSRPPVGKLVYSDCFDRYFGIEESYSPV